MSNVHDLGCIRSLDAYLPCRCQADRKGGMHSFTRQQSFQESSSPPLPCQMPASRSRLPRLAHAKASICSRAALHALAATREPNNAESTPQSAHAKGSKSGQCDPAPPGKLGPSFDKVLASFEQRKALLHTDHSSSAEKLSRPALSRLLARLQALQAHTAVAPQAQSSTRRASDDSIKSTAASARGRTRDPQGAPEPQDGHAAETPQNPGLQLGAQAQPQCNSTLPRAPGLCYAAADAPAKRTISAKVYAAACLPVPADISAEASNQVRGCWDCIPACFGESLSHTSVADRDYAAQAMTQRECMHAVSSDG